MTMAARPVSVCQHSTLRPSVRSGRAAPMPDPMLGRVYGMLRVISLAPRGKYGPQFVCYCDCGGEKIVTGVHLRAKLVRSCGCLLSSDARRKRWETWRQARKDGKPTGTLSYAYGEIEKLDWFPPERLA